MKRFLLPLVAVTIASLLLPSVNPAYACSCAAPTPEQHVDYADIIVIGTVVRLIETTEEFPTPEEKPDGQIPDIDAAVQVERYLKGSGPAEIEVDDPSSGGTCGFLEQASLGQRYLLLLTGETSPLETNLCSGSTPLVATPHVQQFLQEVQAITGPGTLPPTDSAPPADESGGGTPWLAIAASAGILAAASALLLRRRLTRR